MSPPPKKQPNNEKPTKSIEKLKLTNGIYKKHKTKSKVVEKVYDILKCVKNEVHTHLNNFLMENIYSFCSKYLIEQQKFVDYQPQNYDVYNKLYSRLKEVKDWKLNTFILQENKKTARYYAGFIWNWKKLNASKKFSCDKYLKYYLYKTITNMSQQDVNVIVEMLKANYGKTCPFLNNITNTEEIKSYILKNFLVTRKNLQILTKVVHNWLLIFPILQELSLYTNWDFLRNIGAFTMDVDSLYDVLVNRTYADSAKYIK